MGAIIVITDYLGFDRGRQCGRIGSSTNYDVLRQVFSGRKELANRRSGGDSLLLVQNLDVFAWSPYEIPRVNLDYIMHKLNVDPLIPPKKQRLRRSAKSHVEAVREEVEK